MVLRSLQMTAKLLAHRLRRRARTLIPRKKPGGMQSERRTPARPPVEKTPLFCRGDCARKIFVAGLPPKAARLDRCAGGLTIQSLALNLESLGSPMEDETLALTLLNSIFFPSILPTCSPF